MGLGWESHSAHRHCCSQTLGLHCVMTHRFHPLGPCSMSPQLPTWQGAIIALPHPTKKALDPAGAPIVLDGHRRPRLYRDAIITPYTVFCQPDVRFVVQPRKTDAVRS